jgi:hypothetical protein
MKNGKYIQVGSSSFRRLLMTQYSHSPSDMQAASENAFGLVLWVGDDGETLPVNCTHGGSMWLCWPCANAIMAEQNRETGIERHFREHPIET